MEPLIEDLLQRTSRTFALAIPLLPDPMRSEVTLAYLVFRIADTLEDGELLPCTERRRGLLELAELLDSSAPPAAVKSFAERWTMARPCAEPAYMDLLAAVPQVFTALAALDPAAQEAIRRHASRSARGMCEMLDVNSPEQVRLETLEQLRRYCYFVAGIVGEMLTDLFCLRLGADRGAALRQHAAAFGEGLQLVNILKDQSQDAERGRYFLPAAVERARVFELAREDLAQAHVYVDRLAQCGAEPGVLAFTLLPLRLAHLALDCVQQHGPGAKVPRAEVFRMLRSVFADVQMI